VSAARRGRPDRELLRGLLPELLDPGYARAAERRAARGLPEPSGPGQVAALALGAVLIGLVLGVSAADARDRAPGAEQARRGLVQDVQDARQRTDELAGTAADLTARLRSAQRDALGGSGPLAAQGGATLDAVRRLEQATAAVAVTGPGLRITVADAGQERNVLDRDLQVLVNGLWASGAEAIALGGVRLHPLATVRQAGGAVLVDNRPVAQPYVLEAIGDPPTLHTRLVNTDAYGRFNTFAQVYGTRFTVEQVSALSLPAGAPAEPRLAVKEVK
jgi:uncharacterized protein YlxW (UPF0749 family)